GEAVIVGTVDDDRVGTGNVDAVFDDGRRHEHVIFVIDEIEHYLLHFLFVHLAVADGDAGIGDDLLNKGGDRLDRLHAIVDEKHLTVASEFEVDRRADDALRKLDDLSVYRQPIARWR